MITIEVRMSKDEFVDKFMSDLREKKQREYEAKIAMRDYVTDQITKRRKKYHRRHPNGRLR